MSKLSACAISLFAALNAASAAESSTASRSLRVVVPSIPLGVAGTFAILSATGVTDVSPSVVVGNVGASPITGAAVLISCPEVVGKIYSVDAAGPAPCAITSASLLTTAIGDMTFAYNNAAGVLNPDFTNLATGSIGGMTLSPGVYKWTSNVLIASDLTLEGTDSSYDRWVFQIDGSLDLSDAIMVHLSKGAKVQNIVWQVAGPATLGLGSHFEGIVLGKVGIDLITGATVNGRLLAQTAVTLQQNTVVQPQ